MTDGSAFARGPSRTRLSGVISVVDALGRTVELARAPRRIVSLVPSETSSVAWLGGLDRLVGRTRYCVEPEGVFAVPEVGGTKDTDVEAVRALEPDLVLTNQEENARHGVEAMIAAGLPVHVSFPRTVGQSTEYLRTLATLMDVPVDVSPIEAAIGRCSSAKPVRVFVPIWRDPWMTFDGGAFASDLLDLVGAVNVFADRPRRYPLAADLGRRAPLTGDRVKERDTRYPRITLDEVVGREPELVLLPDEPYEFGEPDADALRAAGVDATIVPVNGRDLFWYGARTTKGVDALRELVDAHR